MKKISLKGLFILFVIGITFQTHAQKKKDKTKDPILALALQQYEAGSYEKAYANFLKYDTTNAPDPDVKYKMGICLFSQGKQKSSLPYFKFVEQSKASKKEYELDFYLAQAHHFSHHFDTAATYYEKFKTQLVESNTKKRNQAMIEVMDYQIKACANGSQLQKEEKKIYFQNLGKKINSKYADYSPIITPDEKLLLFTSRRGGGGSKVNTETGEFTDDIYFSNRDLDKNEWTPAIRMPEGINTPDEDATMAISPDGRELLIYRSTSPQGDIFQSFNENGKWSTPRKISREVNSRWSEPSACFSPDGNKLYFSSDRQGGFGGLDIYVAEKLPNGEWGNVKNLGPDVNTPYDEDGPYLLGDAKTMFFSSRGHNTVGGFDVFKTYLRDAANNKWDKPENLGLPLNTAGDEVYLVWNPEGSRTYFSSRREDSAALGDLDIYMIDFGKAFIQLAVVNNEIIGKKGEKIGITSTVTVIDQVTNDTVGVFRSNPNTGIVSMLLDVGKKYDIVVESPGFMPYLDVIDVPTKYFEIAENLVEKQVAMDPDKRDPALVAAADKAKRDAKLAAERGERATGTMTLKGGTIKMDALEVGNEIVLRNIYFDFDKATIKPESTRQLAILLDVLKKYPSMKIQIVGHTDSVGSANYNKKLSQRRSQAVVDYLVARGISPKRLSALGMGKEQAGKMTDELDRRVEFKILTLDKNALVRTEQLTPVSETERLKMVGYNLDEGEYNVGDMLKPKVHFLQNNATFITDYSKGKLKILIDILRQNPNMKIKIVAHSDMIGDYGNNEELTLQRAETVKKYLVQQGINAARLEVESKGATEILTKGKVPDVKNRRVEFIITSL